MKEAKPFKDGLPTGPDVERLDAAYQKLEEGDEISYQDIGEKIREKPRTGRFRTVTDAWRIKLRKDRNLVLKPMNGEFFRVMVPRERVEFVHGQLCGARRKIARAVSHSADIPIERLTDKEKERHFLLQRNLAHNLLVMTQSQKELATTWAPVKSLPKPKKDGGDSNGSSS